MIAPHSSEGRRACIAIVGDLHDHWTDFDVAFLNASDYELIVFVGDLGRGETTSQRIARSIARLELPTLVMPGNADARHAVGLAAGFSLRRGIDRLFAVEGAAAIAPAEGGGARLCGYSLHRPTLSGRDLSIVAGRPYSMGGPALAFEAELRDGFGVASIEDSTRRLVDLVDRVETEALLFDDTGMSAEEVFVEERDA